MELGEAISYSDKAISKWERGEAVPDAYVLLALSRLFGVSVDWILNPHEEGEAPPRAVSSHRRVHVSITLLSFFGIFAAATLAFVVMTILGDPLWQLFIYAVPAALTTLLVFNSVWGNRAANFPIIAVLLVSLVLTAYVACLPRTLWPLFLLLPPAEVIVLISRFLFKKKKKER